MAARVTMRVMHLFDPSQRGSRVVVVCDDPIEANTIRAGLSATLTQPIVVGDVLDAVQRGPGDTILILGVHMDRSPGIARTFPGATVFLLVEPDQPPPPIEGERVITVERPFMISQLAAEVAAAVRGGQADGEGAS